MPGTRIEDAHNGNVRISHFIMLAGSENSRGQAVVHKNRIPVVLVRIPMNLRIKAITSMGT